MCIMEPLLFQHIVDNQSVWGEICRKQHRDRKLEINREQKMRAKMNRTKAKEAATLKAKVTL